MINLSENSKAREVTLKELITGFGFVEGIWLAVGVNPESEVLNALTDILVNLGVDTGSIFLLQILPIIVLLGTIFTVYSVGGKLGMVAVGCAFVSGLLILVSPIVTVVLLLAALVLGGIAENERE